MKYSLITVCLNAAETLRRTIDSVRSQTLPPAEYIFVDGGSADGTLEIISSANFAKGKTEKILLKQKTKSGIYGAINEGIKTAKSEFIFILHSDDWYEKNAAELVLAKFAESSDADVVLSDAYFHPLSSKEYIKRQRSFIFFPFLMPIIHPAAFVRKRVYEKYGLYDENYAISADYEFFYRCFVKKLKFCEIRKPLVHVQLGGFANTNRERARSETLNAAMRHSSLKILPKAAFFARKYLLKHQWKKVIFPPSVSLLRNK
jgi:glycosyltransferase involved in cell wall biosynthesis